MNLNQSNWILYEDFKLIEFLSVSRIKNNIVQKQKNCAETKTYAYNATKKCKLL